MKIPIYFVAALGLTFAANAEEVAVFESGMIQPFSLIFAADGTAYGVEYEKGNRVFTISKSGEVRFIAGRNTPGGKNLGDVAEGEGERRGARADRPARSVRDAERVR